MLSTTDSRGAATVAVVVALLAVTISGGLMSARLPNLSESLLAARASSRTVLRTSSPAEGASHLSAVPEPTFPQTASPVVLNNWDGIAFSTSSLIPPDVSTAAGGTYVVETVNLDMAVYTDQGSLLASYYLG